MQLLVIEYARNCAGLKEANSEEFDEQSNSSEDHLIYHLSKWIKDQKVEIRSKVQNKGFKNSGTLGVRKVGRGG